MHRSRDDISSIEIFSNAKPDGNIPPDRPFEENRLVVVFIQVRISDFSNGGHATSVAKPNIKSGYAVKSKAHVDGKYWYHVSQYKTSSTYNDHNTKIVLNGMSVTKGVGSVDAIVYVNCQFAVLPLNTNTFNASIFDIKLLNEALHDHEDCLDKLRTQAS